MNVDQFADPKAFLDRSLPFLVDQEAANNLLIGIPVAGTVEDYTVFEDRGVSSVPR